jgi:hypothetical protein
MSNNHIQTIIRNRYPEPWPDEDQARFRIYGLLKMRDAEKISA